MAISITAQPAANSLKAAYRPIVISVAIVPAGPVMYADVYFGGVYYKTLSKTQGLDFDIQDAAQEYLKKYLPPNGSEAIFNAAPVITDCYVKIRSSTVDPLTTFTVPDAPVPIQATATAGATPGGGMQSSTFYIVNAALQQEDNQDLPAHLNAFKLGSWDAGTFPLTHRTNGYLVGRLQSDYFPILSDGVPSGIRLHLKYRYLSDYTTFTGGNPPPPPPQPPVNPPPTCVPIAVSTVALPDGQVNQAYSYNVTLTGTAPYSLSPNIVKPSWMNITLNGSTVVLSGTPIADGQSITVSFTASNACGTANVSDSIDIVAAPNGPHFAPTTFVSGDTLNDVEIANLIGEPNSTMTVTLTTLDNTNGGALRVNGSQVFINNTFNVPINAQGNGQLPVSIQGSSTGAQGSVIRGIFTITSVTAGTIGTPNTFQISKVF